MPTEDTDFKAVSKEVTAFANHIKSKHNLKVLDFSIQWGIVNEGRILGNLKEAAIHATFTFEE